VGVNLKFGTRGNSHGRGDALQLLLIEKDIRNASSGAISCQNNSGKGAVMTIKAIAGFVN